MKKNLIYILVVCAVLLLVANLVIKLIQKEEEPVVLVQELSTRRIDSIFNSAIAKFNLDSTWIEKIFIDNSGYDSLSYVYKIDLPNDLPPVKVLRELHTKFFNRPVNLISDEKIVNGYTTLNIFSEDNLKLQASLKKNEDLVRRHTEHALVLQNFSELNAPEQQKLFHSGINFSVLLIPSAESDSLISSIKKFEKTYSILISDQIEDSKYQLTPDQSKGAMEESVRYIYWNYPEAQLYLVSNSAAIFNSASYNFVHDQFLSREITLRPVNQIITLPNKYGEAESRMDFYLESGKGKEGKILLLTAEYFLRLEGKLLDAKKKGAKFYSPKDLLDKIHRESN